MRFRHPHRIPARPFGAADLFEGSLERLRIGLTIDRSKPSEQPEVHPPSPHSDIGRWFVAATTAAGAGDDRPPTRTARCIPLRLLRRGSASVEDGSGRGRYGPARPPAMTQVTVSGDLSYGFACLVVLMGSARPLSPPPVILIVEGRQ